MKRLLKRNLDDVAELAVGTWLVISPFLLSYTENRQATLTAVMIGAFLPLTTLFSIAKPAYWEEYLSIGLGLFLIASPFMLGFSSLLAATINTVASGIVLGAIAIAALYQQRKIDRNLNATGKPAGVV